MTKRSLIAACVLIAAALPLSVSAEEFGTSIPMHEKGAATYYVKTEIDGMDTVDFMVDTGSGYTTINEQTLALLMQQRSVDYVKDLEGILADGSRLVVPVYSIQGMNIGGQCALQDIEVAVFPGKTRQILGLSALRLASPFIFSMDPPQLVLSNCISSIADARTEENIPTEEAPETTEHDSGVSPS